MLLLNYLTVVVSINTMNTTDAVMAQSVERHLGKVEVTGSIPVNSCLRVPIIGTLFLLCCISCCISQKNVDWFCLSFLFACLPWHVYTRF